MIWVLSSVRFVSSIIEKAETDNEAIKALINQIPTLNIIIYIYIYIYIYGCPGQLTRTLTNLTSSEVNDHINLQWSSY
jgi:hypothetical protein